MGDPQHAHATDNGRYYCDPLDGFMAISATNVLNEWSKPALPPAAAKVTAEYIVDHLPQAVRASLREETREEFLKRAKAEYKQQWEMRRDLGTLIHDHAEAEVLGTPITPDERAEPFIDSYRRWLTDFGVDIGLDVESAEVTVLSRNQPRYGGTADLWVKLRFPAARSTTRSRTPYQAETPSGLWLIDIKTSLDAPANRVYREHILQLAALRHAEVALVCPPGCDGPESHNPGHEVPLPQFVGAAILNLRPDDYAFVPMPADESAHLAFRALIGVARYAHALDMKPLKPVPAPTRLRVLKGAS